MAIQASTHPEVAKNQHLVPQTYMNAWSYNNGDSVWVYDKNDAKHPDKNGIPAVRSRSIEKINCINNYHDIKAGDLFTTEAALNEIFGFLKPYSISVDGTLITSLESLNKEYLRFDEWEIIKPDGNPATRKDRNTIKTALRQSRFPFIETAWSDQFESDWEGFISGIEKRVRIIRGCSPGQAALLPSDMNRLMEYLVVFDWRSQKSNHLLSEALDLIFSVVPEFNIEIPESDRLHPGVHTVKDEIKQNYLRKMYYEFLNHEKSTMATALTAYLQNLSIIFCLTSVPNLFITSDRPACMLQRDDGFKEHILVATPTMLITTARTDDIRKYIVSVLNPDEVLQYNRRIAQACDLLIIPDSNKDISLLLE